MRATLTGRLRSAAVPMLAAAIALFAGLPPNALRTGRIEPLDWLVPGVAALAVMMLAAARSGREPGRMRLALYGTLSLLPALLICALVPAVLPWQRMAALSVALAGAGVVLVRALGRGWTARLATAGLCVALLWGAFWVIEGAEGRRIPGAGPPVAVLSALPLWPSSAPDERSFLALGRSGPLLQAVTFSPAPIDGLDDETLRDFRHLLLAQPRLLRPAELVVLDRWVRAGGHAVILADPFLHWPDERPPGDPRRAPLTSLLDPLLTHWGLTLEPARMDPAHPAERRVLAGGSLIVLAGASRFTPGAGAPCVLLEQGLVARCRIGRGTALLVADADWINEALWTTEPDRPRDQRHWTSDTVPVLSALLKEREGFGAPAAAWLRSQAALISALRWALGLILMLGAALAIMGPIPISAHARSMPQGPPGRSPEGSSRDSPPKNPI